LLECTIMLFRYIPTLTRPSSSFYRFDITRDGKCFIVKLKSSLTLQQKKEKCKSKLLFIHKKKLKNLNL